MYVCMYVCMYVRMYVCMYVYIYILIFLTNIVIIARASRYPSFNDSFLIDVGVLGPLGKPETSHRL